MSVCRKSLVTDCVWPAPWFAPQPETSAHSPRQGAYGCHRHTQGPASSALLARCHFGVWTDHTKLAAGVMVNCRSGPTTFACTPLFRPLRTRACPDLLRAGIREPLSTGWVFAASGWATSRAGPHRWDGTRRCRHRDLLQLRPRTCRPGAARGLGASPARPMRCGRVSPRGGRAASLRRDRRRRVRTAADLLAGRRPPGAARRSAAVRGEPRPALARRARRDDSGTPPPCCANNAATRMSPSSSPTASGVASATCCTPSPTACPRSSSCAAASTTTTSGAPARDRLAARGLLDADGALDRFGPRAQAAHRGHHRRSCRSRRSTLSTTASSNSLFSALTPITRAVIAGGDIPAATPMGLRPRRPRRRQRPPAS